MPRPKIVVSDEGKDSYQCPYCNILLPKNKQKLMTHYKSEHSANRPYFCELCDYTTALKNDLKFHVRIHKDEKPYKCKACDFVSNTISHILKHFRKYHSELDQKVCYYRYKSDATVLLNRRTIDQNSEPPFNSKSHNDLRKPLTSSNHLMNSNEANQQARTHDIEKPSLHIASGMVETAEERQKNYETENPFPCTICDYRANTKKTINTHQLAHTAKRCYKCRFCSYISTTKVHIEVHEKTHTGEKPFSCKFCQYRAHAKNTISTHERTHTGERPYQCSFCTYRAITKSCARRHEILIHNEKRTNLPR